MKKENKNVSYKIKKGISGLGLFANRDIKKGEVVIEYIGKMLNNKDQDLLNGKYLFEINNRWTIDGKDRSNIARYINHACKNGNCEPEIKKHQVFIEAKKNIKEGEELCYDYGKEYFNEFIKPFGCRCVSCILKK